MTTIIAGTNRPDSMTLRMANVYYELLNEYDQNVQLLSLTERHVWERNDAFITLEAEYLIPANRFLFIVPEYNGSYPGVLKCLFDNSDIEVCWWHKKALLTGVSAGRAGNLRGLVHLTGVLHYLKMHVYHDQLPISSIDNEIDAAGRLAKENTIAAVSQQLSGFYKI